MFTKLQLFSLRCFAITATFLEPCLVAKPRCKSATFGNIELGIATKGEMTLHSA